MRGRKIRKKGENEGKKGEVRIKCERKENRDRNGRDENKNEGMSLRILRDG